MTKTKRKVVFPKQQKNSDDAEALSIAKLALKTAMGARANAASPKTPFRDAGSIMGKSVFGPIGGSVGGALGAAVGSFFGSGKYKMKSNSMWKTGAQVPLAQNGRDSVRIQHSDLIGNISGTSGFSPALAESMNPGISFAFPYLANIATNFSEYAFRGLVLEYRPTSGNALNSTNTALGEVMMAALYRSDLAFPSNKQQLLNETWSVSTVPSQGAYLPIECDPMEKPMPVQYVRGSGLLSTQDPKWYDLCKVVVATEGCQGTNVVGELWVHYDVELYKPIMAVSTGITAANYAHYSATGATTSAPFGDPLSLAAVFDDIGLGPTTGGNYGTLNFPRSIPNGIRYIVYMTWDAATSASTGGVVYTGLTDKGYFYSGMGNQKAAALHIVEVNASSSYQSTNLAIPCTIVGACTFNMYVAQLPSGAN